MKLTMDQVEHVANQIAAEPIPEHHPTVSQLEELFGQHTFFLNPEGLHVVEPVEQTDSGKHEAHIVKVASWTDEQKTSLSTHGAQLAGTVDLDSDDEPERSA